ncbi:MAG: hypothetical protein AAGA60_29125 [Cyanobacteria bacterium P01_E01_bin.42]
MITQDEINPSAWIERGIELSQQQDYYLFKCTNDIQSRCDRLKEKQQSDRLSTEEKTELANILELEQIARILNAKIIAETRKESQEPISVFEILDSLPDRGTFKTADEVDRYLREERNSWDD